MRISKKVWLIVGIGVFIIVLASLYTIYFREVGEREQLSESLSAAEALLPGLEDEREGLEAQLAQATSLLNTNQAQFPESVESIEYEDDLFEIAADCNVVITRLTASKPLNKKIGAITYSISSFAIKVEGSVANILEFIYAIRTGKDFRLPWSAAVTSVGLSIPGGEANISLDIYGYKGK